MRYVSEVSCARCGRTSESAGRVGLPDPLGSEIAERTCTSCWQEWLAQQIRVINHYGLRPAVREDRERLYAFTREFLALDREGAAPGGRDVPLG
ncbi:MAG: Fe(2+)-trafficking protein [Candidatus Limnocylindria bacterium]